VSLWAWSRKATTYAVLTDILGDEDHLGDMDFKVAGTEDGVTALQMDIKIQGITREIMDKALEPGTRRAAAHPRRDEQGHHSPREEMSEWAPTIISMKIDPEKIRDVIGKGGATIRAITEETGATIDIENDGTVRIASVDGASGKRGQAPDRTDHSRRRSRSNLRGQGRSTDGLRRFRNDPAGQGRPGAHLADLQRARRAVSDKLAEGDIVKVKVLEVDRQGRIRLSMRDLDAA
jgi:polyribonucleotide nucleotidyltransferase